MDTLEKKLLEENLIPLDKSYTIRVGYLYILNGEGGKVVDFLDKQENLSEDLQTLYRVALSWNTESEIDIGESGTVYRFFQYADWKEGLNKRFLKRGTLAVREISAMRRMIEWPIEELLTLDNGTTQWASAATLYRSVTGERVEKIHHAPYKLELTYEAIDDWKQQMAGTKKWEKRYDETIMKQAKTFIQLLQGHQPDFELTHSEDYCFARAFDYISADAGKHRWPSLLSHETNRIDEMDIALFQIEQKRPVTTNDHRVAQACAMRQIYNKQGITVKSKVVYNKSWPQFLDFLDYAEKTRETACA